MKNKWHDYCEMCGITSDKAPLVFNPRYIVVDKKVIELAHEGKMFCCDCLHDEMRVIADEEK